MDFWAPLAIGFVGSFHCVGMCGPIQFALPLGNSLNFKFFFRSLKFNIGRIFTYALLGGLFGGLGFGLKLAGLQQSISIALGIIMILTVLIPQSLKLFQTTERAYAQLTQKVKIKLGKLLGQKNASMLLFAGFLNGLLPCGLVYLAIAGAIASGDYFNGAAFMAFFGLGTLPALFGVLLFKGFSAQSKIKIFQKAIPVFIVMLGVFFVLRGLNLDVPYLSPKISGEVSGIEQCD